MQKNKNNSALRRKIFLGAGKMSGIFQCSFFVLFLSYSQVLSMPAYFIIPAVILCVAVPLFLMPVIYEFINNISLVSTGRYHIALAVSTLLFAVSVSLLFSIDPAWEFGVKAPVLFFALLFTILFYLVFTSVSSSIVSRISEKDKKTKYINSLFFAVGSALFIIVYMLNRGNADLFSQAGYLCASVIILAGLSVFLTSAPYMPKFIRTQIPKTYSLTEKYNKFFVSFTKKDNIFIYLYYFLMCVSIHSVALITGYILDFFATGILHLSFAAVIFLIFTCLSAGFQKLIYKNTTFFIILLTFFCGVPSVAIAVCSFFVLPVSALLALLYVAAIFFGAGLGLFFTLSNQLFDEVYDRFLTTRGTIFNIRNMLAFLSFIFAFAAASLASVFEPYIIVITLSVSLAFLIAACILRTVRKRYLTLEYPEGINDLGV